MYGDALGDDSARNTKSSQLYQRAVGWHDGSTCVHESQQGSTRLLPPSDKSSIEFGTPIPLGWMIWSPIYTRVRIKENGGVKP